MKISLGIDTVGLFWTATKVSFQKYYGLSKIELEFKVLRVRVDKTETKLWGLIWKNTNQVEIFPSNVCMFGVISLWLFR